MKREASAARNVASNWANIVLGIAFALIITPVVEDALGKELWGAWSFLNDLLGYSELFYLGLGSAIIRFVAQARAKSDASRINRLTSVVLSIYTLIGIVCFLILFLLSGIIPDIAREPLSPGAARAVTNACVLVGIRLLLLFVGSAFSGLMCGHDRFDLVNGVSMASTFVRLIAIPLFIHTGTEPLMTIAALMCVVAAIETIAMVGIAYWYVPGLRVRPTRPTADELKLLYGFGLQSFFVLVAFKLISYTDNIVIAVRIGWTAVALYSFPLQIVAYARLCVAGFSGVLLPRLTVLATENNAAGLREAYISSARIGCFIAGWVGAMVIALGPAFITRWIGPEYGAASHIVVIWLTIASFAQALSTQVPYPFYQALNMVAIPAMVLTLEGLVNLALSLWLAPTMGIEGVALATAIPAVFVSLAILPGYLCRKLELPLRVLLLQGALPGVLMLLATLGSQWLIASAVTTVSYPVIIGRGLLTIPVAVLVFAVMFPSGDRRTAQQLLRRVAGGTLRRK